MKNVSNESSLTTMESAKQLISQLRSAASELRKASSWHGTWLPVRSDTDDFVYELLCYFRCAQAGNSTFTLTLKGKIQKLGATRVAALWPRKPGNKANFSYLSLVDSTGNEHYQLCPGIRVEDKFGKPRAPDINLLLPGATNAPTYKELLACWDAKFVSNASKCMADTCVSDFVFTYRCLGSPALPAAWKSTVAPPFQSSGLLTNGRFSTEPIGVLTGDNIAETERFPRTPNTRP